jgi:ABC-2 type transport system ATP-binding protein
VIEVEHLSKSYGTRRAVDDLSFSVAKGEVVGFLGPNGAGKSTTLRMLTGFLPPTAGRIRIDGLDMLSAPVEAKKKIGYMPEACPLYGEMRVDEYLRYRAELKGVSRAQMTSRIGAALEMASVKEVAGRIIGQLSKGTKQRVGLADALVADPPLLVLDEPTAGLDPNQIRQVRDVIKGLAGQKTVLLSTHILPEVEASCGRVVIIHRGKLVREGTPDKIRSMGPGAAVMVVSRAAEDELVTTLRAIEGVDEVLVRDRVDGAIRCEVRGTAADELGERVFAAIAAKGLTLRELRDVKGASLEDVFSALTTTDVTAASNDERADDPARSEENPR